MFRSEPMQKVRIVCLDKDRRSMVSALHKAGILDLRKSALELADDNAAEHFTALSDTQIRLAGAISLLKAPKRGKKGKHPNIEKHIDAERLIATAKSLRVVDRIYALDQERKSAQQSLKHFLQSEDVAKQLSGMDINLDRLKSNVLSFKAYSAGNRKDLDALKAEIKKEGLAVGVVESYEKHQLGVILAYKKGLDVDEIARKYNLRELDLSLDHLHGQAGEALIRITKARSEIEARIKAIEKELLEISGSEYSRLSAFMEMLEIEITKARVSETFKKTDRTIIIEGWVPKKTLHGLEHAISGASGGRYYIEQLATDELAPTLMNRPKMLQPFDYMINFISVPRSDEIDPAVFFMISFPIFYGFMISDVGYGVLSFFFAWYITTITDPEGLVCNTAKIWKMCAISAIVFGFLSNQYFGLALNQYFTSFVGFDWFKSITVLLAVSVIFGLIQVVAGLLIGFVNKYKHHRKIAFGRLTSAILLVSGTIAVAGGVFNAFSNSTLLWGSAVLAIVMLIATLVLSGEEAGEVTNLISHPLSYARLMGFGLASVVLAFLIDQAFTPSLSGGIPWFIISLVLFLVLHFLNMIVSMFEGAVQGARLNFIEFFSKFYTGGGIKFKPFAAKRVYTKE
jgi:V/A-type H+-transporting ATPase subunit I